MQILFADGITNISLSGNGLVRLEFGAVAPAAKEDGNQQVTLNPTQQIVMPLEGFLRAFGTQEQVMKKLMDDGLVQRREEGQTVEAVTKQ